MRCGIGDFGMGYGWEDAEEASVLRIEERSYIFGIPFWVSFLHCAGIR